MQRMVNARRKLRWGKRSYAVFVLCATTAIALPAQTLTTLHSLDLAEGTSPFAGLVQASNGDFYGTTELGGANGYPYGTVFKITPRGVLTTLYSFCSQSECTDGENPLAGLVQATNGDLYGITPYGGANSYGTVFRISPTGMLATLHAFCSQSGCPDGMHPNALIQAANGSSMEQLRGAGPMATMGRSSRSPQVAR